jgi:hypothetical protein
MNYKESHVDIVSEYNQIDLIYRAFVIFLDPQSRDVVLNKKSLLLKRGLTEKEKETIENLLTKMKERFGDVGTFEDYEKYHRSGEYERDYLAFLNRLDAELGEQRELAKNHETDSPEILDEPFYYNAQKTKAIQNIMEHIKIRRINRRSNRESVAIINKLTEELVERING